MGKKEDDIEGRRNLCPSLSLLFDASNHLRNNSIYMQARHFLNVSEELGDRQLRLGGDSRTGRMGGGRIA